ncbi:bacteriocin immunity protein [Larsenimonas salina]|uniref:bacteriocin immunity protein n=1 Tax=Larsenimonas salina TaxID=1295565 RepID=UPI0032ECEB88
MILRSVFEHYSRTEYLALITTIVEAKGSEEFVDMLVMNFNSTCGHPAQHDLIFYPEDSENCPPESVLSELIEWRKQQGLPLFRDM